MALQTETVSTEKNGYVITLTLCEQNVDYTANTSSVAYKFTISNGENCFRADGYSWDIFLAGQTVPVVNYSFDLSKSNTTKTIVSGQLPVQHNADGTLVMPYTVSIPAIQNGPSAMELSGVWELTAIPRSPKVYCPGGFIGNAVGIRVDLRKGLTYTLRYVFGALRGTIAENVSDPEISWVIPEAFYGQISNAKEGVCYLTCEVCNHNGEIAPGDCRFTVKVDPAINEPMISARIVDTNLDTVALTGDETILVRYCSDARVSTTYEAVNGAYVSEGFLNYRGVIYTKSPVDIFSVETGEFHFQATDSRGITANQTVTKEMIPYIKPTCNLGDDKPNMDGSMTLRVSGKYFNSSFGAQRNSLKVEYRYKTAGGTYGQWNAMAAQAEERSYTAQAELNGLNNATAYVFQARVTDALWITDSAEYTVRAKPVFDWDADDFNVNGKFKINEEAMADFVISRGKTSIWTWEKWSSGIVKCWGYTGEKSYTLTGDGPVYHGQTVHSYNYPFALTEVISVNAHIISEGYVVPVILSVEGSLRVSYARLYGGNASVPGRYSFQVVGRWK